MEKVLLEMQKGDDRWGPFKSLQEGYCVVDECLSQLRALMTTVPRAEWQGEKIAARALKLAAMSLKLYLYIRVGTYTQKRED